MSSTKPITTSTTTPTLGVATSSAKSKAASVKVVQSSTTKPSIAPTPLLHDHRMPAIVTDKKSVITIKPKHLSKREIFPTESKPSHSYRTRSITKQMGLDAHQPFVRPGKYEEKMHEMPAAKMPDAISIKSKKTSATAIDPRSLKKSEKIDRYIPSDKFVLSPYQYSTWKPTYPSEPFRLHEQAEIPPFVYDPVYHSIIDKRVLPDLVIARTLEIQEREGWSYRVANRIAVAAIEGEYRRIMPSMVKLYIKSYRSALKQPMPMEKQPPAHLFYPDSKDLFPTEWVSPSGKKYSATVSPKKKDAALKEEYSSSPDISDQEEALLPKPKLPSVKLPKMDKKLFPSSSTENSDSEDSDVETSLAAKFDKIRSQAKLKKDATTSTDKKTFADDKISKVAVHTKTAVEESNEYSNYPAHYNQPYAAFEAQQYFQMPNFKFTGKAFAPILGPEDDGEIILEHLSILSKIKNPKQRTQKLYELHNIKLPPTEQPDFWQEAIEMGFPHIAKEDGKWKPIGDMSKKRQRALSSLVSELELLKNDPNARRIILERFRASEYGQRSPADQPEFLQEGRLYFDLPDFAHIDSQEVWTPAADVVMARRAELENLATELANASSAQDRIRILTARHLKTPAKDFTAPKQPEHLKEWQMLSPIGIPYFELIDNEWAPIGKMGAEVSNNLKAIAQELQKLDTPEQRIAFLKSSGMLESVKKIESPESSLLSKKLQPEFWLPLVEKHSSVPLLVEVIDPNTGRKEWQIPKDFPSKDKWDQIKDRLEKALVSSSKELKKATLALQKDIADLIVNDQLQPRAWQQMMAHNDKIKPLAVAPAENSRGYEHAVPENPNQETQLASEIFNQFAADQIDEMLASMKEHGIYTTSKDEESQKTADSSKTEKTKSKEQKAWDKQPNYWKELNEAGVSLPRLKKLSDGSFAITEDLKKHGLDDLFLTRLFHLQTGLEKAATTAERIKLAKRYGFYPNPELEGEDLEKSKVLASQGQEIYYWDVVENTILEMTDDSEKEAFRLALSNKNYTYIAKSKALQALLETLLDEDTTLGRGAVLTGWITSRLSGLKLPLHSPQVQDLISSIRTEMEKPNPKNDLQQRISEINEEWLNTAIAEKAVEKPVPAIRTSKVVSEEGQKPSQPSYLNIAQQEYHLPDFEKPQAGPWTAPTNKGFTNTQKAELNKISQALFKIFTESASLKDSETAQRQYLSNLKARADEKLESGKASAKHTFISQICSARTKAPEKTLDEIAPSTDKGLRPAQPSFLRVAQEEFGLPKFEKVNGKWVPADKSLTDEQAEFLSEVAEYCKQLKAQSKDTQKAEEDQRNYFYDLQDDVAARINSNKANALDALLTKYFLSKLSAKLADDKKPGPQPRKISSLVSEDLDINPYTPTPSKLTKDSVSSDEEIPSTSGIKPKTTSGDPLPPPRGTDPADKVNKKRHGDKQPKYWGHIKRYGISIPDLIKDEATGVLKVGPGLKGGPSRPLLVSLHNAISGLEDTQEVFTHIDREAMLHGLRPDPSINVLSSANTVLAALASEELRKANNGNSDYWLQEAKEALQEYADIKFGKVNHKWAPSHPFLNTLMNVLLSATNKKERKAIVQNWMQANEAILNGSNLNIQTTPIKPQPNFWIYARQQAPFLPLLVKDSDGNTITKPERFNITAPIILDEMMEVRGLDTLYETDPESATKQINAILRRFGALANPEAKDEELARSQTNAEHFNDLHWYKEVTQILHNPPQLTRSLRGQWEPNIYVRNNEEWTQLIDELCMASSAKERSDIINRATARERNIFLKRSELSTKVSESVEPDFYSDIEDMVDVEDDVLVESLKRAPKYWLHLMQSLGHKADDPILPDQHLKDTSSLFQDKETGLWHVHHHPVASKYNKIVAELQNVPESNQDFAQMKNIIKSYGMEPDPVLPEGVDADELESWKIDNINLARLGENTYWWQEVIKATAEVITKENRHAFKGQIYQIYLNIHDKHLTEVSFPGVHLSKASDNGKFIISEQLENITQKLKEENTPRNRESIINMNFRQLSEAIELTKLAHEDDMEAYCTEIRTKQEAIKSKLARMRLEQKLLNKKAEIQAQAKASGQTIDEHEINGQIYGTLRLNEELSRMEIDSELSPTEKRSIIAAYAKEWIAQAKADEARRLIERTASSESESDVEPEEKPKEKTVSHRRPSSASSSSSRASSPELEEYDDPFEAFPEHVYTEVAFSDSPAGWQNAMAFMGFPSLVYHPTEDDQSALRTEHKSLYAVFDKLCQLEGPNEERQLSAEHYVGFIRTMYTEGFLDIQGLLELLGKMQDNEFLPMEHANLPESLHHLILGTQISWWRPAIEIFEAPPMIEDAEGKLMLPDDLDESMKVLCLDLANKLQKAKTDEELREIFRTHALKDDGRGNDLSQLHKEKIDKLTRDTRKRLAPQKHPLWKELAQKLSAQEE